MLIYISLSTFRQFGGQFLKNASYWGVTKTPDFSHHSVSSWQIAHNVPVVTLSSSHLTDVLFIKKKTAAQLEEFKI